MNKSKLLCTPVERNFQVLRILVHFSCFQLGTFWTLPQKGMLQGVTSSENHIKQSSCRYETVHVYEQTKTTLHFCRKQFSSFANFSSFFELLTWDILDIASEKMLQRATSSENHIKQNSCRYEMVHLYEQIKTALYFCRKQFLSFAKFQYIFLYF